MSINKLSKQIERILSCDYQWLLYRLRLSFGLRCVVPRPEALISRFASTDAFEVSCPVRKAPIKLLVFSHNLSHEGASISLKELVCGLTDRQIITHEVVAFEDGPLRAEYESRGIPVKVLPSVLHNISTLKRLNLEVERLAMFIQASEADLVFVNTLLNFLAVLAAEHAGVPSIWNPRESEPWDSYFRFLPEPVAQRAIAAIGLPRKVVFVAEATRAVWREFDFLGNFTVIHNALNLERFVENLEADRLALRRSCGWHDDEKVFLNVGTLCERKGQMDVLYAVDSLSEFIAKEIRLVFAGNFEGSYKLQLTSLADRLVSQKGLRIDFVEATPDIGAYYRAADVFIMCSRVESYPRVILEAMAFGLPVISTPVFGVTEQISAEEACFYEPSDIKCLAAHMEACIVDEDYRKLLGEKSRQRFNQLESYNEMNQRYQSVLEEAVFSSR